MALALVIGMAAVLFIGLASLTFITREETGQASKFIFNIKAECLSEAIHTFLLSESFAYSWDARFYKDRQIFSSEAGGVCAYPVELMKKSIKRIIENDPVLKNTVGFDGYIESETIEGMRVIIICVNITLKVSMLKNDVICTHTYYDLYKRDLLDSLGETITFFYSESGNKQKKIGQDIKKSLGGSLSFENEVERRVKLSREDRKKIMGGGKGKG
ncbi:MAG TPA: hypothetical protein PKW98_07410, partial [Candidatus Wallbacteria bacterium]|nr:hypothetical protein [Candidatus Wallbacteria bacterium]